MNLLMGVELPDEFSIEGYTYWVNRRNQTGVAQNWRRTVGGALHKRQEYYPSGISILLDVFINEAVYNALKATEQDEGTFQYGDFSTSVAYDHSNGSAISVSPIFGAELVDCTNYYEGSIQLITV